MEVGPWRMDGKGGFQTAEGGWEEYTTMVYGEYYVFLYVIPPLSSDLTVDQPAGTGFSYTSTNHYVHTLEEVNILPSSHSVLKPH